MIIMIAICIYEFGTYVWDVSTSNLNSKTHKSPIFKVFSFKSKNAEYLHRKEKLAIVIIMWVNSMTQYDTFAVFI